jgi:uncharacterized iron-regulated membrane protein
VHKTIVKLHLYLALAASLFLLVICITGCLLVFEVPMDRWLDPKVSFVEPGRERVPYAAMMSTLRAAYPGQQITEMDLAGPGTSVIAKMSGHTRAFVDPYTGKLLGAREGEPPSFWLRHVHRELLGGNAGAQFVRLASFIVLFQSVSGLYLWWPIKRVKVRWGAPWRRVNFDLHYAVGFFSCAFVCLMAATGLIKGYGDDLQPFFNRVTGTPAASRALTSQRPKGKDASAITMDDAVAVAQRELPGATAARLTPPKGPDGTFLVTMKYPGDSTAPGRSWVVVDRYSGRVLGSQDARTAPLAARIPIVNRELHVGGIYGIPTRMLAALTSLAILVQVVTGFNMWRRKPGNKAVANRTRETVPAQV